MPNDSLRHEDKSGRLRTVIAQKVTAQAVVAAINIIGLWFAFHYWGSLQIAQVVEAAGGTLLATIFAVWLIAFARTRKSVLREERSFPEVLGDLLTDVLIALFISTCLGIIFSGIVKLKFNGPIDEPFKEAFYVANIALVSFAALIMVRTALAIQHGVKVEELLKRSSQLIKEVRQHAHDARDLIADAGAGTALASLLKQGSLLEEDNGCHADIRSGLLDTLTAAGWCSQYWANFALIPPSETVIPEAQMAARSSVLLATSREFFRESASDVARRNRLVVSNIGFVTSSVCSALIDMQKHCKESMRPIWLAVTTYEPELWFEDEKSDGPGFLSGTGIPEGTLLLQYWGRYIRTLRYLMQGGNAPICIRAHISRSTDGSDYEAEWSRITCTRISNHWHTRLRSDRHGRGRKPVLTLKDVPNCTADKEFLKKLAAGMAADAACAIPREEAETWLRPESAGVLGQLLLRIINSKDKDPDAALAVLEYWHEHYNGKVAQFVRDSWDKMQRWELEYLSGISGDGNRELPRISDPRGVREALKDAPGESPGKRISLEFLDGSPLEVMLDALLLYEEWIDAEADRVPVHSLPVAIMKRWHGETAASAYFLRRVWAESGRDGRGTSKQAVTQFFESMPETGDFHAFGLAPCKDEKVDWRAAQWLMAFKSEMQDRLGVARADFLRVGYKDRSGAICVNQFRDPEGAKEEQNLVGLSDIAEALTSDDDKRIERKKFERQESIS